MILALSQTQGIVLALVGAGVLLVVVVLLAGRRRQERDEAKGPDIPPAMRPGPSDPNLEKPLLLRLQGWALVLLGFSAIWIPLYWFNEPAQNKTQEEKLRTAGIAHGKHEVELFTEENQAGVGCVRCHGPELKGQENLLGVEVAVAPNLTTVCERLTVDQIRETIEQGRGKMPSWSVKYKGALNDQQIQDLILYITSIQDVPAEKNKCLQPEGESSPSPAASPAAESPGGAASPAGATA